MDRQWCSAQCLKTNSQGMIYRVFFFFFFFLISMVYMPHHGKFQATNEMRLNSNWKVLQLALESL